MTRQTSDDELIRRHLAGDGDAFDALARRHSRYAYGLCYRMLGDHHAAEDASQEAFLKAAEALGGFRGEVPLRSWFRRILVNVCLNWRLSIQGRAGWVTRTGVSIYELSPPTYLGRPGSDAMSSSLSHRHM